MWWLKGIGSIWIAFGCAYFGWQKGHQQKQRIAFMKQMVRGLQLFKSLSETYRLPLGQAFLKISAQTDPPVSVFFADLAENFEARALPEGEKIWCRSIGKVKAYLTEDDYKMLKGLSSFIGIQDIHRQVMAVDDCILELKHRIHLLETELPIREKIYSVCSLAIGGFLILILI